MKSIPLLLAIALSVLANGAASANRRFVPIQDAPETELCRSTTQAVAELRKDPAGLYGKFRNVDTRAKTDLQVGELTFYAPQTRTFNTVDSTGVSRTYSRNYYLLDVDNTAAVEMIAFSSGGHGAAGEGDTLSILENNISSAPSPVANEEFAKVTLEISSYTTSFSGKDFDGAYFIYPFGFQGRNYLLIEGNRLQFDKDLVAEVVAGPGLVTRCYFNEIAAAAPPESAAVATWPKQRSVRIKDAPESALCRETQHAITELRGTPDGLIERLQDPRSRATEAVEIEELTFYPLRTKAFTTVDRQGVQRTNDFDYYLVDIDNVPPVEMITSSRGGYGNAGFGNTLQVLNRDLSAARQPIRTEELVNASLQIGPWEVSFEGRDFDAGYYIYIFSFRGKNYLFIEGNGDRHGKDLVAELVPTVGIETRCYF